MLKKIYEKNPFFRKYLLTPFAFNTNPNRVSLCALITAFVAGGMFYYGHFIFGAFFVLLNGYLDLLDGEIAKKHNRARLLGDFIDHFFDRIADIVILMPLAMAPFVNVYVVFIAIVLMLLASYLGVASHALLNKRNYKGFGGRAERLTIVFFSCLLMTFWSYSIAVGLYLISFLCLLTVVERFCDIYSDLNRIKLDEKKTKR